MRSRHLLPALLILAAVPAQARAADLPYRQPAGTVAPNVLPASGARAASVQPDTWLVGARPGPRAQAIATRHGAELLTPRGIYVVARGRAAEFATALRAAGASTGAAGCSSGPTARTARRIA
jgi:hypothetical protein